MRLSPALIATAAFVAAAVLALLAALALVLMVERRTEAAVNDLLQHEGLVWAAAATDGLQVHLSGTAPNEAQRFRAMNLTGSLVDAGRIRDEMQVTPTAAIEAPRFSVELLRNDDGISLIGLIPAGDGPGSLAAAVAAVAEGATIADMLTEADYPAPADWQRALDYGLAALDLLPRSKISIAADAVAITAIAGSEAEKRRLEAELARSRPAGIAVRIDISAPRPVLTPFTLRFVKDAAGARFDACAADTEAARDRILAAAVAAGVQGKTDCPIALGVPTPSWAEATAAGIAAIAELGGGTITFADADVTLLALQETPQATYDRVVGELQTALPDVFSLQASLPEKPKTDVPQGPPEFTASLSPEGKVELRGRLTDEAQRDAVTSFARARFGADSVYQATRLDPDLPDGWPVRVLAGLAVLSELHDGKVTVQAGMVTVAGVTGSTDAQAAISRVLSGQLGQGQAFAVNVTYDERLDPLAALPTPQECVTDLNAVLAQTKIAFAPGSAEIEAAAGKTMEALAEILRRCPDIPMEIAGHTDSQGSESGNLALSQARAEAVLMGLQGRRVPVGALSAVGYGESAPIADNSSDAGRETNRRIEFSLVGPLALAASPVAEPGTPLAQVPVTVPVNADPKAAGAKAPKRRPEDLTRGEEAGRVVLPGFGTPEDGALLAPEAEEPMDEAVEDTAAAEFEADDEDPVTDPAAAETEPAAEVATDPAAEPAEPATAQVQAAPAAPAAKPATVAPAPVVAAPAVPQPVRSSVSSSSDTPVAGTVTSSSSSSEPFVSSAPQEMTQRPADRPATP